MSTSRSALPEGYLLEGEYELLTVLGAGGFGITYKARYKLGNYFAVKEYSPSDLIVREGTMILPYEDSEEDYQKGLADFLHEARTLARFSHPNIVKVARIIEANNTAYMVLEFEEGQSLRDWLRNRESRPSQSELDAIAGPLLDALALIHADNILHRDVAPDNIYVRANGTPVLLDFGSARPGTARSQSVSAIVKAGYSPQEQYSSRAQNQGPWTDIYSLGATLYKAVTGEAPPDATERVVDDEYRRFSGRLPSGYRSQFLAAIDWALEVRPDDRPASIDEWRGPLLHNQPVPRRPRREATPARPNEGWLRFSLSWQAAVLAIVLAFLSGFGTWYYTRGEIETAVASIRASTAQQIAVLEAQLVEVRERESRISAELAATRTDLEARVLALTRQTEVANATAAGLEDALTAARSEAAAGEESAAIRIAGLEAQLRDAVAYAGDLEARLRVDRGDLEAGIADLEERLLAEQNAREALRIESATLRVEIEQTAVASEQALAVARLATGNAEAALASAETHAAEEAQRLEGLVLAARKDAEALTLQLEQERQAAATSSAEAKREAEETIALLTVALDSAKEREAQLVAESRTATEGFEARIAEHEAKARAELSARTLAEQKAENAIADLTRLREEDAQRIAQLDADLAAARQSEQAAVASLASARESDDARSRELAERIALSAERTSELEAMLSAERESARQAAETARAETNMRIAELNTRLAAERERAAGLEADLAEARESEQSVVADLTAEREASAARERELTGRIESEAETLNASLAAEREGARQAAETTRVEAEDRIAALNGRLTGERERVVALEAEMAEARTRGDEQTRALTESLATANGRIEELEAQLDSESATLDLARTELGEAEQRIAALDNQLANERDRVSTLAIELATSRENERIARAANNNSVRDLTEKIEVANAQAAELEALLTAERDAAIRASEGVQAQADARIAVLRKQLAEEQESAVQLGAELEQTRASRAGELAVLRRQLIAEQAAKDNLLEERAALDLATAERIAELEAQLADSAAAREAIDVARRAATEQANAERAEREAADAARKELETQLAAARFEATTAAETAEARVAELEADWDARLADAAAESAASIDAARQVADEELAQARNEATVASGVASARIAELETAVAAASTSAEIVAARTEARQAELEAEIEELDARMAAEAATRRLAEDAIAEARERYETFRLESEARIAELALELSAGRVRETEALEALQATARSHGDAVAELNQQLLTARGDATRLEQELSTARETLADTDARVAELDNQLAEAREQVATLDAAIHSNRESFEAELARLEQGLQDERLVTQSLADETQVLMGLATRPSVGFAGVELVAAGERGGYFVRGVDPVGPFADALQPGVIIEGIDLNGETIDLASLTGIALAACDVLVATLAGGADEIAITLPQDFERVGADAEFDARTGLALRSLGTTGPILVSRVDAGLPLTGLRRGDVIRAFDGRPIETVAQLHDLVEEAMRRGGSRTAEIDRNCERVQVAVDFGAAVQSFVYAGLTIEGAETAPARIAAVAADSVFSPAGLLPGDLLDSLSVNGARIELASFAAARDLLPTVALCGAVDIRYARGETDGRATVEIVPHGMSGAPVALTQFGVVGLSLNDGDGILVDQIMDGGRAGDAGIRPGDIITAMGGIRGSALAQLGASGETSFLRQGGVVSLRRGCEETEIILAAHDPNDDLIDMARLSPPERRFIIRALYAMNHYPRGELPTEFVTVGEVDAEILDAFARFRGTRGAADAALSRNDADYLIPFGQTKLPGELEEEALRDVVPPLVALNPVLIDNRLRLWASQRGFDGDTGREALALYHQSLGRTEHSGYVTGQAEAHAIFAEPLPLAIGQVPTGEQSFLDWRYQQVEDGCIIYVLPTRLSGDYYQFTRNASRADRPALWLGVYRDAGGTLQMNVNFGGNSEFDPRLAVTVSTADGASLPTRWSGSSLLPPLAENGAHTSNVLHKALLVNDWVEIAGTSKYGRPLAIRFGTSGFLQAFEHLDANCAEGTLASWIR